VVVTRVPYVAELDEKGRCVAVSELAGVPKGDRFIVLPAMDDRLLGKRFVNGSFAGIDFVVGGGSRASAASARGQQMRASGLERRRK